jgi:hypothetical protein
LFSEPAWLRQASEYSFVTVTGRGAGGTM